MSQPLNRYKADLREFQFLLFEQLGLGDILEKEPYGDWGPDEIRMVVDECYRYCTEIAGPLNAVGDREGCRVEDGSV